MYPLLETINSPADLRLVPRTQLKRVADELRDDFVAEGKSAGSSGATKSEKGKK